MQDFLQIYIHIYDQVAHNLDTFYATKLIFGICTKTKTIDFMVELPLAYCHIEHRQNGNRIISLVPLLALES